MLACVSISANFTITLSDIAPSTNNYPAQDSPTFTKCYQYPGNPPYNERFQVRHSFSNIVFGHLSSSMLIVIKMMLLKGESDRLTAGIQL